MVRWVRSSRSLRLSRSQRRATAQAEGIGFEEWVDSGRKIREFRSEQGGRGWLSIACEEVRVDHTGGEVVGWPKVRG
jgi:hypothetical protein